jgi:SAM-dependent methyltransferase
MSFYGADLAHVHDVGFGGVARSAAPAIVDRLRAAGIDGGTIAELGCGSGIAAAVFAGAGYDVLGVDVSEDLLAIARERAPGARFVHASVHDAELPDRGAVAVVAIGEVLSYAGIDDRLLGRVRGALSPGGLFVFDVVIPGREGAEPRRAWTEGDGWLVCVEASEDPDARRLTRRIATFRRDGDGDDTGAGAWRRSDEVHEQTLYDPAALAASLTAAGFEDARVLPDGYGAGVDLPHHTAVLSARAPAV